MAEILSQGIDGLTIAAARLVGLLRTEVHSVFTNFQAADGPARDTVRRAILVRAIDSYESIELLVRTSSDAANARPFLRPMCEDYIFLKWLESLDDSVANGYLLRKAVVDLLRAVAAQQEFLSQTYERFGVGDLTGALGLGFGDVSEVLASAESSLEEFCREQGREWRKIGPSVYEMAKVGGLVETYNFLYLATSKSVHANLHDMLRMVWGDPKTMTMTVGHGELNPIHRAYSIVYGCWLLESTLGLLEEHYAEISNLRSTKRWLMLVALIIGGLAINRALPPLVTEREVRWPGRAEIVESPGPFPA